AEPMLPVENGRRGGLGEDVELRTRDNLAVRKRLHVLGYAEDAMRDDSTSLGIDEVSGDNSCLFLRNAASLENAGDYALEVLGLQGWHATAPLRAGSAPLPLPPSPRRRGGRTCLSPPLRFGEGGRGEGCCDGSFSRCP